MQIQHHLQGSREWFEAKQGTIGGTTLGDILGTPYMRSQTLHEIIGERLTPEVDMEHLHEPSLSRGMRLEDEAVRAFEYVTGLSTERCGFCISDDNQFIGYSPDARVIGHPWDVECKCPEGKNYMKIVLSNEVPKEYHWQIVQGFVVDDELEIRYFCAYNPDIPSRPIHIIECKREDYADDIAKALEEQKKFLEEVEDKLKTLI
jgi:hypothetical protein